jgi:hypothetical protein
LGERRDARQQVIELVEYHSSLPCVKNFAVFVLELWAWTARRSSLGLQHLKAPATERLVRAHS